MIVNMETLPKVAGYLLTRRITIGMSQNDLAKKAGLVNSVAYNCENGMTIPRLDTLVKVATALGLEIEIREVGK